MPTKENYTKTQKKIKKRVCSYHQYLSTFLNVLKSDKPFKSYSQIIINVLKLNPDYTAHAANILFSLIRHQATRGAIGWLSRPSGAIKKDRWRSRLGMLMKKAELL